MQNLTVFLPAGTAVTCFPAFLCRATAGCPGRLVADGSEDCLLWKSSKWVFAWEVFYQWGDKVGKAGVAFFTFWNDTVDKYKG